MNYSNLADIMIEFLFETLRKEKNKSYDDIAGYVYGTENMQQSRLKLYHLRKPMKNGLPKKMSLEEFVRICDALEESPTEILGQLLGMLKRGK